MISRGPRNFALLACWWSSISMNVSVSVSVCVIWNSDYSKVILPHEVGINNYCMRSQWNRRPQWVRQFNAPGTLGNCNSRTHIALS
jgi:hypothetical protein